MQISNVTLAYKTSDFLKRFNIDHGCIYICKFQDCVTSRAQNKTVEFFLITYLSPKYHSLNDLAGIVASCAVCSGYPLVSSKLAKMLGFKGYLPLPLSPTPRSNENWDSPYSHVNVQN